MTEDIKEVPRGEGNTTPISCTRPKNKYKRDILRIGDENETAINLDHITHINIEGKNIRFNFYNSSFLFDVINQENSKILFENIINLWCGDVVG